MKIQLKGGVTVFRPDLREISSSKRLPHNKSDYELYRHPKCLHQFSLEKLLDGPGYYIVKAVKCTVEPDFPTGLRWQVIGHAYSYTTARIFLRGIRERNKWKRLERDSEKWRRNLGIN
jgi:hypothetical protein